MWWNITLFGKIYIYLKQCNMLGIRVDLFSDAKIKRFLTKRLLLVNLCTAMFTASKRKFVENDDDVTKRLLLVNLCTAMFTASKRKFVENDDDDDDDDDDLVFTSLQHYRDTEIVMMKSSVQWSAVQSCAEFHLQLNWNPGPHWSKVGSENHSVTQTILNSLRKQPLWIIQ